MIDSKKNTRRQEILNKIQRLAGSYTPEWIFDTDNPDVGTAIGLVYADQSEETLSAMADIAERYHTEFVNFLDLSLLPAKPAKSVCLLSLVGDTIPGSHVPKNTKLVSSLMDREDVIFETDHSLYVTGSRITDIFMTGAKSGRITPLKGRYEEPVYIEKDMPEEWEDENPNGVVNLPNMVPFSLFNETRTIGDDAILFYHTSLFDVAEGEKIYVRIEEGEELYDLIMQGKRQFFYYTSGELTPVDGIEELGDGKTIKVSTQKPFDKVNINDVDYSLLVLRTAEPVSSVNTAGNVLFASKGDAKPAVLVTDGNTDMNPLSFMPFVGDLSLYSEVYIGCDDYFAKGNSRAKISFDLSFVERQLSITREEEDKSLKIIKRKPRVLHMDVPVSVYAQEIVIEYFNGIGWSTLPCDNDLNTLFADGQSRSVEFAFTVPTDWEPTTEGSATGRYLRIRLLKADNCYLRPAIHYMPLIQNLDVEYTYQESYVNADKMVAIRNLEKRDITYNFASSEKPYALFAPSNHHMDALYLGFDRRIEEGPVSIFFRMNEDNRFAKIKCRFEYSTSVGFSAMKVVDHTESFTKSGTIMFVPMPDMEKYEIEGKKRYWIRIVCNKKNEENDSLQPRILSIDPNAVMVSNIETSEIREFYLDEVVPGMSFDLVETNILSADVWVNELGNLSSESMMRMEQELGSRIRCTKNDTGIYTSFFVLWDEASNFLTTDKRRVYMLDRANHRLIFGDGIHADYPRMVDASSFMVRIRRCVGSLGNVPENSIRSSRSNIRFIGSITNPIKAYGGSDMESIPMALTRGANMLHSRDRLISVGDYERAIKSFSDSIDKVKCLVVSDNNTLIMPDKDIVLVILMKDYGYGSFSFHHIKTQLEDYICQYCELTISKDRLGIMEPVFVELSVDIWADVLEIEDSFELAPLVQQVLDNYLNPVKEDGSEGWAIGTIPRVSQIQMCLSSLKSRLTIKKVAVTAEYTDSTGVHTKDLAELEIMPYMVAKSGNHNVHIMH